jgi:hypothetical protein
MEGIRNTRSRNSTVRARLPLFVQIWGNLSSRHWNLVGPEHWYHLAAPPGSELHSSPHLRKATTTTVTSATIVAGLATLPGSATSRGRAGPTSSQGAARPISRSLWRMMTSQLFSTNTAPESDQE